MKVSSAISEVLNVLKIPNEERRLLHDIYIIKYSDNIKSEKDYDKLRNNPEYHLVGREKIRKYNSAFEHLYNSLGLEVAGLSSNEFRKKIEQLLFFDNFTEEKIREKLKSIPLQHYHCVDKIYGINIENDMLVLGKYTLLNPIYISHYLKEKIEAKNHHYIDDFIDTEENADKFIYVICDYSGKGVDLPREKFDMDLATFINILRYMIRIKNSRLNIDLSAYNPRQLNKFQFSDEGSIYSSFKIDRKDVTITLYEDYITDIDLGFNKIWEITNKDNKNDFENRIMLAIDWVGQSLQENNDDMSICKLAFAFESLFHVQKDNMISPSIQYSIAESVAFLIGKTPEERINIKKRFKEFYSHRSSIVHGGSSKKKSDYDYFLSLLIGSISYLLTDENFANCKNGEDISNILDMNFKFK